MSYIELSIPDPAFAQQRESINRWEFAVRQANEACLVLNTGFTVVAASPGCSGLLAVPVERAVGRRLVDVLLLLDFNSVSAKLPEAEVEKIPPLIAISTGVLARGLLRVPGADGTANTVDAISVPLLDRDGVTGSLTFFAPVGR